MSQFLAGKGMSTVDHLPYSPDFWLFQKPKSELKRKHFLDVENIKSVKKKFNGQTHVEILHLLLFALTRKMKF
jgi:hypothetical protein